MSLTEAKEAAQGLTPAEQPGAGMGEEASAWAMRATEWLAMRLPRRVGVMVFERYFRILHDMADGQRRTVTANLAQVLGHPADSPMVRAAVKESFRLYGRYWYETFALRTMPWEEADRRFVLDGREHIDRALKAGRGIILTLPHMGNWDAAGHWLCIQGYRMTAVAEELKPRTVFDLFLRHRRALGMNIVPLSSGTKAGEALVGLLARNHIVTLVADRDLTNRGVPVKMFGATHKLPAGPAFLSLATGAPLCVSAVFTTDEGWHCRINPPLRIERTNDMRADVRAMTELIGEGYERFIAAAPTDWHMFQLFWDGGETA